MRKRQYFNSLAEPNASLDVLDNRDTAAESEWFRRHLPLAKGDRLLDIGCGQGRLTKEFLDRGYDVHGVDLSDTMIMRARDRYPDLTDRLILSSFESFDADAPYDYALSVKGGAFGIIEGTQDHLLQNLAFIRKLHSVLKPSGIALIEYLNAAFILHNVSQDEIDSGECLLEKSLVKLGNDLYEEYYTENEIALLFGGNGFTVKEIFCQANAGRSDASVSLESKVGIVKVQKEPIAQGPCVELG